MTPNNIWDEKIPTDAGRYWFFGWKSGMARRFEPSKPSLACVTVHDASNGVIYVADGQFMHESKRGLGVWKKCENPSPPSAQFIVNLFSDICTCGKFRVNAHGCSCRPD